MMAFQAVNTHLCTEVSLAQNIAITMILQRSAKSTPAEKHVSIEY